MIDLSAAQTEMRQRQLPEQSRPAEHSYTTDYLTPAEVAARLKISVKTVIRKFEHRFGVLNLGSERKPTMKGKREKYAILRIPQAALTAFIAERVQ